MNKNNLSFRDAIKICRRAIIWESAEHVSSYHDTRYKGIRGPITASIIHFYDEQYNPADRRINLDIDYEDTRVGEYRVSQRENLREFNMFLGLYKHAVDQTQLAIQAKQLLQISIEGLVRQVRKEKFGEYMRIILGERK
jgi:hypothetical protein